MSCHVMWRVLTSVMFARHSSLAIFMLFGNTCAETTTERQVTYDTAKVRRVAPRWCRLLVLVRMHVPDAAQL